MTKASYVAPSDKETKTQLHRVRNGLPPEYGFALDFSKPNPVLKYSPAHLKDMQAASDEAKAANDKALQEDEEYADILLAAEAMATIPRSAQTVNDPKTATAPTS